MKVLIMNGPAESGKGTVVKYIKELFVDMEITEYSSINYVKEVAFEHFGWDGVKDTKGRNLLSAIKQTMIAYNDYPTKKIVYTIDTALGTDLLVVDIREPDEIEKLVNHCKDINIVCHTCRVINTKIENDVDRVGELSLTGDRLYGEYDYDINIRNNGTLEELKKEVLNIFGNIYENGVYVGVNSHSKAEPLEQKEHNGSCAICGESRISEDMATMGIRCRYCGQLYKGY